MYDSIANEVDQHSRSPRFPTNLEKATAIFVSRKSDVHSKQVHLLDQLELQGKDNRQVVEDSAIVRVFLSHRTDLLGRHIGPSHHVQWS